MRAMAYRRHRQSRELTEAADAEPEKRTLVLARHGPKRKKNKKAGPIFSFPRRGHLVTEPANAPSKMHPQTEPKKLTPGVDIPIGQSFHPEPGDIISRGPSRPFSPCSARKE